VVAPSELTAASFQRAVAFETAQQYRNSRGTRVFADVLVEALDAAVPQAADKAGAFQLSQLRLDALQYAQLAQEQRQALLVCTRAEGERPLCSSHASRRRPSVPR